MKERFEKLDKYRVMNGQLASPPGAPYGFFFIRRLPGSQTIAVMAAPFDGQEEWEHVSASLANRCPTWDEMAFIKNLFWNPEDTVIQFHPPESQYVNNHSFCLHLWRNTKVAIPTPPMNLIGDRRLGVMV